MAEKNADGLVVRYGLEQAPDIVLKAASDCQKAYVVDMKGPMKEEATDLMIPKGTYIPDVILVNDEAFASSDAGTVTVALIKKEDGTTSFKTLLNAAAVTDLNAGDVITPASGSEGFITPYDCIVKVTVSGNFSAKGKARLIMSAITSA